MPRKTFQIALHEDTFPISMVVKLSDSHKTTPSLRCQVVALNIKGSYSMSNYKKLAYTIRQCKCHIVWYPKYRFRIFKGAVVLASEKLRAYFSFKEVIGTVCEVYEFDKSILLSPDRRRDVYEAMAALLVVEAKHFLVGGFACSAGP